MDRKTGRLRGFGFITFANPHAVNAAIRHKHNTELHGQTIRVSRAYPRISSYEYNCNHGNAGTSGKYSYFNHGSEKYGNNKNHTSHFTPHEDCYSGNEGKSGNYHESFRYYAPYKGCYDGSDDVNGKSRNNNKTSSYSPHNDCYGKNRSNSCFNCGRTGHWARDCIYPRDDEFDNDYPSYQFFDNDCANQQRQKGGDGKGNKCFNCGRPGHWALDCLKQRDGRPGDLRGKQPVSPDAFDYYGDNDEFDYDDFTMYCDYCEDFGHFILECPNLGRCCSNSHPKFCDCDGGPYLREGRFDGSCLQCGGHSLWSVQGNPNFSTWEQGESSCGPCISGKRYDGWPKKYYNGQYRYSSGAADFSYPVENNRRNYDLFGAALFEEEPFVYRQLGKNNGRNLPRGTRFHSSSQRNRRHYDAFEEGALFEEGVSKNHNQQGNCNDRTMRPDAIMGGERSGSRQNHGHKNDQYDRIDGEHNEGQSVRGHNAGAQSQPSGPHASSRRPTGGSSRRPQNGAQGGNSVRRDSRDDVNERRRHGKDPVNVFIIVEKGGRS